jgi:hypothetical protein
VSLVVPSYLRVIVLTLAVPPVVASVTKLPFAQTITFWSAVVVREWVAPAVVSIAIALKEIKDGKY